MPAPAALLPFLADASPNGTARWRSGGAEVAALERGAEPSEWVFTDPLGGRLDAQNFRQRVWKPLLDRAGLRHVRVHDLRHSYASLLIQDGWPLKYLQEQLGHHSIAITSDVYGHLVPVRIAPRRTVSTSSRRPLRRAQTHPQRTQLRPAIQSAEKKPRVSSGKTEEGGLEPPTP